MLRLLLHRLGLHMDFYLTCATPLPSTLLVAAAACLLPAPLASSLLSSFPRQAADRAGKADSRVGGSAHLAGSTAEAGESSAAEGGEPAGAPGTIEVRPAPGGAAAASARGPGVRSGQELACPVGVHLQALLALREQLTRKVGQLQGGSWQEDIALASAAAPGSATRMALVRTNSCSSHLSVCPEASASTPV